MSIWQGPRGCESGGCVEVAKCELNGCVEVNKDNDSLIKLRSSLSPYGVATMTVAEFRDFIQSVKDGDYDHFVEEEPTIELGIVSGADLESAAIATGGGFKSKNLNLEMEDGGALTWETAEALAKMQVLEIEQRREQQILKEGYTCDL